MAVQVELTVMTGRTHLPVIRAGRSTGVVMATTALTDAAFQLESGDFLVTETGDFLLTI